jgi:hypothetical protein
VGPKDCSCGDGYTNEDGNWVSGDQARAQRATAPAKGNVTEKAGDSKLDNKPTNVDEPVAENSEEIKTVSGRAQD